MKNVWDEIYEKDVWGNGSGPGSSELATREYREFVQQFIGLNQTRTVLDFGCGDGVLTSLMRFPSFVEYSGTDASEIAVMRAKQNNIGRGFSFFKTPKDVPFASHDLCLLKDVLQHLSWAQIHQTLHRLSECKIILVTNDIPRQEDAHDIEDGQWRPIDIREMGYRCAVVKEFDSVPLRKRTLLILNK